VAARIEALRAEIRRHDHLYYVLDRPEISDEQYDRLHEELRRLEAGHPELVTPDSPTQRVGGATAAGFATAWHAAPMLSLESTRNADDVRRFDRRLRRRLGGTVHYVLEPKLDGLSVELVYVDGELERVVTRGDGRRGEVVTENALTIRSVPRRLRGPAGAVPRRLSVRGEVMMSMAAFEKLNRRLLEAGSEPFANPRNAAAGSMRQLDARITARRPLVVFCYDILAVSGPSPRTGTEVRRRLRAWGFRTPERAATCSDADGILRYHAGMAAARDRLPWEIDGIVIKVDDLESRDVLGATSHHPRWGLAYKFEPRQGITRVTDIVVQVGRTGLLTPVALLRPVEVSGVTVSRATLHNQAEIRRRDVRVGDLVRVQRAGDVIPEIVSRVVEDGRRGATFRMPARCPGCGTRVETRGPLTCCPNRFGCPAQLKARLVHFGSRPAMDIEGLGAETAALLVDRGMVRELADLYTLTADQLRELPHFAELSATKLVQAIRNSRRRELHRFLFALGIPGVGAATARAVARRFRTLDAVRAASAEELASASGVGPMAAQTIHRFFRDERNRQAVDALLANGVTALPERPEPSGDVLAGKRIAFTGALRRANRQEAEALVEALGAEAASSVSRRTDIVVTGSRPGSKLGDARRLGVRVMDEDAFFAWLDSARRGRRPRER